jgi:putative ABC transport system permease protein
VPRLLLADLVGNARIWLGIAVVCAASAAVVAVAAATAAAAVRTDGDAGLALYGISGVMLLFTAVAAIVVLGSVAGLTVALHRRDHALWQLVGVRPGAVRVVVLVQLLLVGLLGALLGCLAAAPVLGPYGHWVFTGSEGLGEVDLRLGPVPAAADVAVVGLLVLAGGWRPARRAARVSGLALLREAAVPRLRMGPWRWVLAAVLLALVVSVVTSLPGDGTDRLEEPLSMVAPLVAGLLVAVGPLVTAALTRAWTGLVPTRLSASWYLARNVAFADLDRSTAAINPLVVTIALTGGLYSAHGTVAEADAVRTGVLADGVPAQFVVLLLGGPLLLAAVGAAAAVAMSGRSRARDAALLEAAGATPGLVLATAAWEAVIQVGTAALLGGLAVAGGALAGAWAVGSRLAWAPSFGLAAVGGTAAAGLALVLVATVVPALLRLRRDPVRLLTAE